MRKSEVLRNVAVRPLSATRMAWNHRRTLRYLWRIDRRSFWSHIFTTYFIRGEDCGKGILDPLWKLTGWAPYLWDLEMETTTACYLQCIHCEHTYWKDKAYLNQHLSLETLRDVLDSAPKLHWINLTGEGTSVLNPDFNDMVDLVKSRGIYLDFSHDFVKLSKESAIGWILSGVDRIYWSFDGCTKGTYETIRVGANFDKVIDNVRGFLKLKVEYNSPIPELCFRFAFFKDNIHEVNMIPKFLFDLVDGHVELYGDEPSINIVALLEFEQTKGWEREIDQDTVEYVDRMAKQMGFKIYWSHLTHVEEQKPPLDYCTFWSEPYIMITGHVVPCCAVLMSNNRLELERLAFGNIHDQSLRDIWFSEKYRKFRKAVVNPKAKCPEVCRGCRVFNTANRDGVVATIPLITQEVK